LHAYLVVAFSKVLAGPTADFIPYYTGGDELFAVGMDVLCDGQRSGEYHRRLIISLKRVTN
jgi:hypothetical protein